MSGSVEGSDRSIMREVYAKPGPGLAQLLELSDEELGKLDIAGVNLICAAGLPGADGLKINRYLDWLDDAAREVNLATERNYHKFLENSGAFQNSQAYFCIVCMIEILQTRFGVRYNPKWQGITPDQPVPKEFGQDANDVFIHPIIDGIGGTCGSLPIVYIAIGRRLGYPLKIVKAARHLFARWDDPNGGHWHKPERFNIEASGRGVHLLSDDHYRTWPHKVSEEDIEAGIYLKSLSPREELAEFLATRGFVCLAHNRLQLALHCFEKAAKLSAGNRYFAKWRDYVGAKRKLLMRGDGFVNAPSSADDNYPAGPFWVRTPQGQELLVQIPDRTRVELLTTDEPWRGARTTNGSASTRSFCTGGCSDARGAPLRGVLAIVAQWQDGIGPSTRKAGVTDNAASHTLRSACASAQPGTTVNGWNFSGAGCN